MSDTLSLVSRPEFETLQRDVKAIEREQIEMRVIINQQTNDLGEIKGMLRDQRRDETARGRALRNTVIAANTLGPTALGVIYAFLKAHGWIS